MVLADEIRGKLFRLIGCRAVADGKERHMVFFDEGKDLFGGSLFFRVALRDLQDTVIDDLPGGVHDGHFAAGAVAGIQPHHHMPRKGGLQQELAQVRAEDADGLRFCVFRELAPDFALQRGEQETFVAVLDGQTQFLLINRGALMNLPEDADRILRELKGGSNASYAVRFAASFPNIAVVLSGMSDMVQMQDNISAMKDFKPLSDAERDALHKVCGIFKGLNLIPCTSCRF